MGPTPQLSCEQCRLRKRKCDKNVPCSTCKQAGLQCEVVQRARLPRGRSGKIRSKNKGLESRVGRIEELLKQAQLPTGHGEGESSNSDPEACQFNPSGKLGEFVAPNFWSALSKEVAGIRETIEDSDDEDESPRDPLVDDWAASGHDSILFEQDLSCNRGNASLAPSHWMRETLLDIYRDRVDNVFKIVHWPTTLADIRESYNENRQDQRPQDKRALESAIYFMALCSTNEDEFEELFETSKAILTSRYRGATETLIAQTKLMQGPNLISLQAFVIYLQGLRMFSPASSWTLVAVAVRLASALGLGSENPTSMSGFELELRRRLWYVICLLDTQATLDRGSIPLVSYGALGPPPLSVNDSDISPTFMPSSPSEGFTDMTVVLMTFEAMTCHKRLCEIGGNAEDWPAKLELISAFDHSYHQKYIDRDDVDTPVKRLCQLGAQSILASMHLLLRRPPYRQARNWIPASDDFDIMDMAAKVLADHLRVESEGLSPWAWEQWVPWYALAVVLAELCNRPNAPASDSAYLLAERTYQRYSRPITDPDSGMLWKPIAKLLRRVQRLRSSQQLGPGGGWKTQQRAPPIDKSSLPEQWPAQHDAAQPLGTSSDWAVGAQPMASTDPGPDEWFMNNLAINNPAAGVYQQDIDTSDPWDLHPENGVSWLDWDNILQDNAYSLDLL